MQITPMPLPGSPGDKGPAGRAFVDAGATMMNLNSPTYLAASGWDWMPAVRDRVAGIWNHVRLRSHRRTRSSATPAWTPRCPTCPTPARAEVTIVVPVRNADTADHGSRSPPSFDDVRVSQTVTVPAGGSDRRHLRARRLRAAAAAQPQAVVAQRLRRARPARPHPGRLGRRRRRATGAPPASASASSATSTTMPLPFGGRRPTRYTQSVDLRPAAGPVRADQVPDQRATGWGISLWTPVGDRQRRPAPTSPCTRPATASSVDERRPTSRGNVTDGDAGTRWSSTFEDDQWIQVDLGSLGRLRPGRPRPGSRRTPRPTWCRSPTDGDTWTDVEVGRTTPPCRCPSTAATRACRPWTSPARTARYVRIRLRRAGHQLGHLPVDALGDRQRRRRAPTWPCARRPPPRRTTALQPGRERHRRQPRHPLVLGVRGQPVDPGRPRRVRVTFDRVVDRLGAGLPQDVRRSRSPTTATAWTDVKSVDNTPDPLKISVNGVRVFARGGNWGWDELLRRMPPTGMDDGGADAPRHELHHDPQLGRQQQPRGVLRQPATSTASWCGTTSRNAWAHGPAGPRRLQRPRAGHRPALPHPPQRRGLVRRQRGQPARRHRRRACARPSSRRHPASSTRTTRPAASSPAAARTAGSSRRRYFDPSTYGSQALRLPHRDRHAGGVHGREHAQPRRRRAGVADRRARGTTTTGAPAVTRRRSTTRRRSRPGSVTAEDLDDFAAQGAVRQLREHTAPCSRRGTPTCGRTPPA